MRGERHPTNPANHPPSRGFTLMEVLVLIVVLGIAGALVIPSMSSVHVLRVQASIRAISADIAFAQSDAIAFQRRRAVMFDVPNNLYRVVDVPSSAVSANNALFKPGGPGGRYVVDLKQERFGGARLVSASFNTTESYLLFDEQGMPAMSATSDQPGLGGTIVVEGSGQRFNIVVDAFTGRVITRRIDAQPGNPRPGDPTPVPNPNPGQPQPQPGPGPVSGS